MFEAEKEFRSQLAQTRSAAASLIPFLAVRQREQCAIASPVVGFDVGTTQPTGGPAGRHFC